MCGVDTSSAAATRPGDVSVRLAGPSLALDQPLTERTLIVHELLVLSGWAISPAGPVEVTVEVGGCLYHAARGLPSPDLAELLPEVDGSRFGRFELHLPIAGLPRGTAQVQARVTDAAGEAASLRGTVLLHPFERAVYTSDRPAAFTRGRTEMWCDAPDLTGGAKLSAPVTVSGWAHCAEGIEAVFVDVDDKLRIEATRGLMYPYPTDATARRVGFAATIDPREIGPGRHALTVIAVGRDGRSVGMRGDVLCLEPPDPCDPPSGYEAAPPAPVLTDGSRFVPAMHAGMSLEAEHYARYRWAAALARDRRILDVACGSGFGTEILAVAGAASVVGLDAEPVAVEEARRRLGTAARIELGRIERLPFRDHEFDLVVCFETIEHVEGQETAFDELQRVLALDGILVISSPNRGVFTDGNPFHLAELTSRELETELRRRFRNVTLYRQQTHVASYVLDDPMFAIADSGVDLEASARKLVGGAAGEELYTLALAGDSALPTPTAVAVLGGALDARSLIEQARRWEERAVLAEADAAAWRADRWSSEAVAQELAKELSRCEEGCRHADAERQELEIQRRELETQLNVVLTSRSWRLTRPLRATVAMARGARSRR